MLTNAILISGWDTNLVDQVSNNYERAVLYLCLHLLMFVHFDGFWHKNFFVWMFAHVVNLVQVHAEHLIIADFRLKHFRELFAFEV